MWVCMRACVCARVCVRVSARLPNVHARAGARACVHGMQHKQKQVHIPICSIGSKWHNYILHSRGVMFTYSATAH